MRKKHDNEPERRDASGRYLPGTSGNPNGRPPLARNRGTEVVDELLEGQAQALAQKAIEMALGGDVLAMKLCIERLAPARRERQMLLQLPAPSTGDTIAAGFGNLASALTNGELTPSEANSAAQVLESACRAMETTELARRVEELEKRVTEALPNGA